MDKKIKIMTKAGRILAEVIEELLNNIRPGVSELEIDSLAEKLIIEKGGEISFKLVPGYKNTICVSTNDVVVHGIPTDRKFNEGDIVGIDCGVYLNGYHTDMAQTLCVRSQNSKLKSKNDNVDKFLDTGKRALFAGIEQAKPRNRVGHISREIQKIVEGNGYSVVRSLVGHGVGRSLHESPEIPGYLAKKIENTPELKPGMTIAVEVIYNMGDSEVVYSDQDDWTILTEDKSLSGLFERTILITEKGPKILTKLAGDKI